MKSRRREGHQHADVGTHQQSRTSPENTPWPAQRQPAWQRPTRGSSFLNELCDALVCTRIPRLGRGRKKRRVRTEFEPVQNVAHLARSTRQTAAPRKVCIISLILRYAYVACKHAERELRVIAAAALSSGHPTPPCTQHGRARAWNGSQRRSGHRACSR